MTHEYIYTYNQVFHSTWSLLPLSELSPEVVLETTPVVPALLFASDYVQFTQSLTWLA